MSEQAMTDEDLIAVALDFRKGILIGRPSKMMCFAVSAPLQGFLSAVYGIETEQEEVDFPECNHVYLRLPDGRILDATADQFGLEPVYLGEMPSIYKSWMDGTGAIPQEYL